MSSGPGDGRTSGARSDRGPPRARLTPSRLLGSVRSLFPLAFHPVVLNLGWHRDLAGAWRDLRRWTGENRRELLWLSAAATLFTAVLGWVQVEWYLNYFALATDIGFYNQALSTTVQYHQFFRETLETPAGYGTNLFAGHLSPFLVLLLPIYALAPGPSILLVLKQAALALAAFPLYAIARRQLGSPRWGLALALLYLANPLTMQVDWTDFDPEVFLPLALLLLFLFFESRRFWPALCAAALTMSVIESGIALVLAFAALSLLTAVVRRTPLPFDQRRYIATTSLAIGLVAVLWLLAFLQISHMFGGIGGSFSTTYAGKYQVLGATSLPDVYVQALTHPAMAWSALQYGGMLKLGLVLALFGAFAFLPFLGEVRYLLTVLLLLPIFLLGSKPSLYQMGGQYAAYLLPFLLAGWVGGVRTLRRWVAVRTRTPSVGPGPRLLRKPPLSTAVPLALAVAGIVTVAPFLFPLLPDPLLEPTTYKAFGLPEDSFHAAWLNKVLALVPPHAPITTVSEIFPQVSNRPGAHVVPGTQFFRAPNTYGGIVQGYVNGSRFVLLDFTENWVSSTALLQYGNLSDFGLLAVADGIYLYERGWQGGPELWLPSSETYPGSTQGPFAATVDENVTTPYGPTLVHNSSTTGARLMWRNVGGLRLTPGTYTATFWVSIVSNTTGLQLTVNLTTLPEQLTVFVQQALSTGYYYGFSLQTNASKSSTSLARAWNGNVTGPDQNLTVTFTLVQPSTINVLGILRTTWETVRLYTVSVNQTAG